VESVAGPSPQPHHRQNPTFNPASRQPPCASADKTTFSRPSPGTSLYQTPPLITRHYYTIHKLDGYRLRQCRTSRPARNGSTSLWLCLMPDQLPYVTASAQHHYTLPSYLLTHTQTNITTRYSLKPAPSTTAATADTSSTPRATLVLKTYDSASGITLKYRTTKAAEVSRLIGASLGRLGRSMAAVPEPPAEEAMPDAPVEVDQKPATTTAQAQQQVPNQGGGGKKKKKGKK
jgi:hypothetical protein